MIKRLPTNIKIYIAAIMAIIILMLFFFQYFSETLRLTAIKEEERQMFYVSNFSVNVVRSRIEQYGRFMRTTAGHIVSIGFNKEKSANFLRNVSQSTDFKYMDIIFPDDNPTPSADNVFPSGSSKIYATPRIGTITIKGKDYLHFSYPIIENGTVKAQINGYVDAHESLDTSSKNIVLGKTEIIYFRSNGEYLFAQNSIAKLRNGTNVLDFIQGKKNEMSVPLEHVLNAISSRQSLSLKFKTTSETRLAHIEPVGVEDWYVGIFLPAGILENKVKSIKEDTVKLLSNIGIILFLFILYIIYIERKSLKAIQNANKTAENLIAGIPGGVFKCRADKDFTYELVSQGLADTTGYSTPAELIEQQGSSFWNSILTEDRILTRATIMSRLRREGRFETIYRMKKHDGEIIYVLCKGGTIQENSGDESVCAVIIDITETQKTIEKLIISEGKYKAAIAQADIYVSEYDTATDVLISSDKASEMFATPHVINNFKNYLSEVIKKYPDSEGVKIYGDTLFKAVQTKEQTVCFYSLTSLDGKKHYLKTIFTHVEDDRGGLLKIIGISEDITALKNAELKYIETQKYKDTIAKLYERIYEYNLTKGTVILGGENYSNYAVPKQMDLDDIRGSFVKQYVHPDDRPFILNMLSLQGAEEYLKKGMSEFDYDYRCKAALDSEIYTWKASHISIFVDPSDKSVHTTWFVKDITETMTHKKQLLYQAERDLLTGLYNKTSTEEKIRETIRSNPEGHYALIMADIDNFKSVNDTMGHLYGDTVIIECAKKISEIFKTNDIKGRTGGDEFIIFAEECSLSQSQIKTAALYDALRKVYNDEDSQINLSISCGISYYPSDGQTFETLYNKADIALYHSKDCGKNCVSTYTKSMGESMDGRKTFTLKKENRHLAAYTSQDVFKTLCRAKDITAAVESSLKALADNYGFTRLHVFLKAEKDGTCTKIFEWNAQGQHSSDVYGSALKNASKHLLDAMGHTHSHIAREDDFPPNYENAASIIGSIITPIKDNGEIKGFISIGGGENKSLCTSDEIRDLTLSAQTIAVFLIKEDYYKKRDAKIDRLKKSIQKSKEKIYIVDADTHEVLFSNMQETAESQGERKHLPCYLAIYGFDSQCTDCILKKRLDETAASSENIAVSKDEKGLLFAVPFEFYNGKNTYFITIIDAK